MRARAVPANFHLVSFDDTVRKRLSDGYYDVVICHTIRNLFWLWPFHKTSFVFIAHIPLFKRTLVERIKSAVKCCVYRLFAATHKTRFHAVSEFKRQTWGVPGEVAVLSPQSLPPLLAGVGYDACLVICNDLASRGEELGISTLNRLRAKFPITILGKNPGIDGAVIPKDFSDFTDKVRRHRIYIYTVRYPLGDGYNTAMLEAMRLGMAIVTVDNPSSPIVHGVNGLVGRNEQELGTHIETLLSSPDLVDRLGAGAKATVERDFSASAFLAGWTKTLKN